MTTRASSHDPSDPRASASTHASPYQNAALQGAALAFAKPPLRPKPNTQTVSNGALAAAARAGGSSNLSPLRSVAKDSGGSSSPGTPGGGGLELAPFRERLNQVGKADSSEYLLLPSPGSDRSISPSRIAAALAASRSAPITPNHTGQKTTKSPRLHRKTSSSGRSPGRSVSRSRDIPHDALDTTSIPPTTSLIGLFERSAETAPSRKGTGFASAATQTKKLGVAPPQQFVGPVVAAKPDPVKSPKPVILPLKRDQRGDNSRPPPGTPRFSVGREEDGSSSDDSFVSASDHRSQSAPTRTRSPPFISVESRAVDSLATAIVASSLASSRAASPSKSSTSLAPPLSPARRGNTGRFHHHNIHDSRTPSPAKGLRQTMRKPPKDEEDDDPNMLRRGRKNIMKKHPNKHHEGDRKRWRDSVTERERKRYEAVWASNKGLHVPNINFNSTFAPPPSPSPGPLNPGDAVSNIVVKDIWTRSRLGPDVLSEVWELVDRTGTGVLSKEEFVVGLWLIDQRLKGRKLPIRVGDSVWSSITAMGGVKVRGGGRKR